MRQFSYERSASLYRAIQGMDEPASLYIIRTDGHSAFAPEHNHGEYNILRLPDYDEFDGIILDINSIANAILHHLPDRAVPVRYGGDEFLVLAPAGGENEVRGWINAIAAALPGEAALLGAPDEFGVSSGFLLTDPTGEKSLDEYVTEADALMYREKRAKKLRRGE